MSDLTIKVRKKESCEDLPLPSYMSAGSSGMDLYADVESELVIEPGDIKMVSAGIYISIPQGFEAQIRPRSGLAAKHGISIVNTPGTIDADYRGLINIILINLGKSAYTVKRGMRIAQMVINKVSRAGLDLVNELDATARNTGGFGHTGV
ncbi:MAG: dUTP diphosphatase [Candidatus Omnitrophica bacterium]|nr:dUTP diphosphatase [Candidatus Omnitrophota bacterium]MBU1925326.1 dUTP diphosphatase [Candidatus Omnitrophota bacterium]MBU2063152.1 dUTP diphosphatase [Candidatus Omnitrophota bacterium]